MIFNFEMELLKRNKGKYVGDKKREEKHCQFRKYPTNLQYIFFVGSPKESLV